MNPNNLGLNDYDSLHKETQTSNTNVNKESKIQTQSVKPCNPRISRDLTIDEGPIFITEKSDKGSITTFEFREVLQDPESPQSLTIVRESITEEIHNHPSDNLSSNDSTSNRYRYCREVIKPYLKEYPSDCPSDEILVKDILDFAKSEFPDYQPCYEVFEGEKDIIEKKIHSDKSILAESIVSSDPSKVDVATSCKNSKTSTPIMDSKKSIESLSNKESGTKPSSSSDSIKSKNKLSKGSDIKLKSSSDSVKPKDNTEKGAEVFGILEPVGPAKSSQKIPKVPSSPSTLTDQIGKFDAEAHIKTLATLKCAMEDFAGIVCETTKDAVTVIKTESVKQLENFKKNQSSGTDLKDGLKDVTATALSFFRKIESPFKTEDKTTDNNTSSSAEIKPPLITGETLGKIAQEVDSKMTMIGHKISESINDALKRNGSVYDRSSPYDVPIKQSNDSSSPKKVSNIMVSEGKVPASSSVFSAIKLKIKSLFYDEEKTEEILSTNSSSEDLSLSNDDDDDVTNK